jgi:lysophospholipase L1-like esterase
VRRAAYLPLVALAFLPPPTFAAELELRDGDRVVLLGNTLIEREQRYGYWEAALTSRYPDRNITFRNLGWSGDTVWGEARARFGTAADGFKHLKEHVVGLKPTVILVGYGTNESFAGEAGLPRFLDGLDKLLAVLGGTKARVVLLSPLKHEDLGRPLPDPTAANRDLKRYRDALESVARKRGNPFVDLYGTISESQGPLTDNGMHLTGYGYWRTAEVVEGGLLGADGGWRVRVGGEKSQADGTKVESERASPPRFKLADTRLPLAPPETPRGVEQPGRVLTVAGLPAGRHTLRIDGKAVTTAGAEDWARGVRLEAGPEFEQAEQLRRTVVAKNREYFYRWRPQNETYLFGFRKHEQGNNAAEVPLFDPIVEKLEKEIAKLRVPVAHVYEIVPEKKEGER